MNRRNTHVNGHPKTAFGGFSAPRLKVVDAGWKKSAANQIEPLLNFVLVGELRIVANARLLITGAR
jgi:hypothetical protein